MNDLRIFDSPEFGQVRTMMIDGEPWFVGKDVAEILGYANQNRDIVRHVDEEDRLMMNSESKLDTEMVLSLGQRGGWLINESGLYGLIISSSLPNAKKFKRWVTSEVLPAIRKTGTYTAPLTTAQQIQLLAQGNVDLANRIEGVENKVESLENDMPLYSCEVDEIQGHVKRKAVKVLGGKDSEAYQDASLRASVFKDMYGQLKREYGCVASYKSIKRRYIADVHEFIDGYELPTVLSEQVQHANAQLSMAV